MTSALPFDDFRELLGRLPPADREAEARVKALFARAGKPDRSLGRIEDIAAWLAAWSGRAPPSVRKPLVAIFAGNHGVARHHVSPRPVAATAEAGELCAAGGAAINQVCIAHDPPPGLRPRPMAAHGDITGKRAGRARLRRLWPSAWRRGRRPPTFCASRFRRRQLHRAAAMLAALFGGTGADWVVRARVRTRP